MIIIYYKDKDGKITHHHASQKDITLEELGNRVRDFNRERADKDGKTAHIFDAEDDGLTAYLFQKAAERKKWDAEALQDAISSIEDALDSVRGLQG